MIALVSILLLTLCFASILLSVAIAGLGLLMLAMHFDLIASEVLGGFIESACGIDHWRSSPLSLS